MIVSARAGTGAAGITPKLGRRRPQEPTAQLDLANALWQDRREMREVFIRAVQRRARREGDGDVAMELVNPAVWYADWTWTLPLIMLTVVVHVLGLQLINERFVEALNRGVTSRRRFLSRFAVAMSLAVLAATVLHAMEAGIWAAAYRYLGALPDYRSAMLYSLGAITTYGHANLLLEDHWKLMGPIEALNGMLLFGLTTAFLFAMIREVSPLGSKEKS